MSRRKLKISSVIIVYSIIIGAAFLFLTMRLQTTMNTLNLEIDMDNTVSYSHSQEPPIDSSVQRIYDRKAFKEYSLQKLYTILVPTTIVFFIFIIISSILLWKILNQIRKKENQKIIHEIRSIQWNHSLPEGAEDLQEAYDYIRQEYEEHMEDFRRLNSYLSHDQRNTLMLLKSNIEHERKEASLKNVQALSDSIDDILTLSDHFEEEEKLIPVDVVMICANICDNYQKVYPNITFEFEETEDMYILAKPRWIRQAIGNLVDNAVKYGEDKDIIVSVTKKKDCIIIKVKDHGIGIQPRMQERIFQHRYRINELNKDGYGIGLSLVMHVCDLCRGFVFCESIEGEGTEFSISFQSML